VIAWTAQRFASISSSPRLDAEVLLAHCLGVDRVGLYVDYDKPLTEEERGRFRALVRRRLAGEPVAYLVGEREFWSLPLEVGPGVLVPRPETELLVELTLARLRDARADAPCSIDVGTGSGAVAVAASHELGGRPMWATDIVPASLQMAARNADRHGVSLRLVCGDLLAPFVSRPTFDLIVANLPYIPTAEMAGLAPDVGRWEPTLALDGGPDGLVLIRRLVPQAATRLRPGGTLMLEMDPAQAAPLAEILGAWGLRDIRVHDDLAGRARVVEGSLPGCPTRAV
jgi:release factor glutamine methyltransferase